MIKQGKQSKGKDAWQKRDLRLPKLSIWCHPDLASSSFPRTNFENNSAVPLPVNKLKQRNTKHTALLCF
jgi:hypothetical protein